MAWSFLAEKTGSKWEPPPKKLACHVELKGWLLDWIGKSSADQTSWFFTMLYILWQARNDARETKILKDPKSIALQTCAAVEEWNGIHGKSLKPSTKVVEHWLRPEAQWHKINSDGAFNQSEGNGGGGVVLRDHHGDFQAGASHFFTHVVDAEGAELLACRKGLILAKDHQVQRVVLETDSLGVAMKLRQKDRGRSIYGPIIQEIKELLQGFVDVSIRTVRKTVNGVAHALAKEGCINKVNRFWLGVPPASIVNTLVLDGSVS
jgi:ribonuclease HI